MVDVQKHIIYWREGAVEDLQVAGELVSAGRSRHGLFFAHLALEKLLKAHVCRTTQDLAPHLHTLLRLAERTDLILSDEQRDFLARFDRYQIEGRYPDVLLSCSHGGSEAGTGQGPGDVHMVDPAIVKVIQDYLRAVNRSGVRASRAVLFGSYARGEAGPDSDLDLLILAAEFDGPYDRSRVDLLWRLRAQTDSRIEPVPVGERQWLLDQTSPIIEVARREGHEIAAS